MQTVCSGDFVFSDDCEKPLNKKILGVLLFDVLFSNIPLISNRFLQQSYVSTNSTNVLPIQEEQSYIITNTSYNNKNEIMDIKETILSSAEGYSVEDYQSIKDRLDLILDKESLDEDQVKLNKSSFSGLGYFIKNYRNFKKNHFSIMINDDGKASIVRNFNNLYVAAAFLNDTNVEYDISYTDTFQLIEENDNIGIDNFLMVLKDNDGK